MSFRSPHADDRMDSATTHISKYGPLSRNPKLLALRPMMEYLESAWPKDLLYDIYYGDDTEFKSLHATEFFSQSLLLTPCNDEARYQIAQMALDDDVAPIDVDALVASFKDKYRLIRKRSIGPQVGTIFLPGSNILDVDLVDWTMVSSLVDKGFWIKPHPITTDAWLDRLNIEYPGRVHRPGVSGKDLLFLSENVASSSASELGLMGMLLGKDTVLVDADNPGVQRNIYRQLYRAAMAEGTPKDTLARVLASPYSGIWWTHEPSRKADRIIDIIGDYFHGHHGVHRKTG